MFGALDVYDSSICKKKEKNSSKKILSLATNGDSFGYVRKHVIRYNSTLHFLYLKSFLFNFGDL